jgi:hypothetical protein
MWPFDRKKGVDAQQNQETIDKTNRYIAELNYLFANLDARLQNGGEADINKEKDRIKRIFENISKIPNFQNNEELKIAFNRQVALINSYELSLGLKERIKSLGSRAKYLGSYLPKYSQMTNENKSKFENDCKQVLQIANSLQKEIYENSNKIILRFVEKNFKDINYDLTSINIFLTNLKK